MNRHAIHKQHVVRRADRTYRALAYLLVIVIVTGSVAAFITYRAASAVSTEENVEISASMSGFSQNEIRVKVGAVVNLRLTSLDHEFHEDGGGQHQWAVDELGINLIAPPLGTETVRFTPDKPGVYIFYCDICCGGRNSPTMQGTLVVTA